MHNAAILDYSFSSFWPQPMRNFESSSLRSAMLRLKNMAFLKKSFCKKAYLLIEQNKTSLKRCERNVSMRYL